MRYKKELFTLICLVVSANPTFAQGTISFANDSQSLVMRWTSGFEPTHIPVPVGGGFVQLAYAPVGTPFTPYPYMSTQGAWLAFNVGWTLGPTVGFNTPLPGRFNGGSVTLDGIPRGADAQYVIFGWTGNAATFDEAVAEGAYVGASAIFTTPTGNFGSPPSLPVPLSQTFTGFTIGIPEPSSFALFGIGALVVFGRRARKATGSQGVGSMR